MSRHLAGARFARRRCAAARLLRHAGAALAPGLCRVRSDGGFRRTEYHLGGSFWCNPGLAHELHCLWASAAEPSNGGWVPDTAGGSADSTGNSDDGVFRATGDAIFIAPLREDGAPEDEMTK